MCQWVQNSKQGSSGWNVGISVSLEELNSDFTPWRMISSNAWVVLCKVLGWLSVRFRQEMSVVKCHLLLSSEPQKLPHSTTQKQENFPFFKNIFALKKRKKVNDVLPWPSIGRTSVSCAKEICDVKHHQLLFHAEKVPIRWHKS